MIKLIVLFVAFVIGFSAGSAYADPYRRYKVPSAIKSKYQMQYYRSSLNRSPMVDGWYRKVPKKPPKQRRVGRAN